jgi:hypothetical protein
MRAEVHWTIHPALLERLKARADADGRKVSAVVEQACAEYLAIPLANRDLPEQPCELCPNCKTGVLRLGICPACNWRRNPEARDRIDRPRRRAPVN